jgi:cytochrome P450
MTKFDPFAYYPDPFPVYRRLRNGAPVYRDAERNFWVLSRFDDVDAAARDWRTFSSAQGNDLDDTYELWRPGSPESIDPPDHGRLRDVVRRQFTPKTIAALEVMISHKLETLLRPYHEAGRADLVQDLAFPLPFAVICELLGFPEADGPALGRLYRTTMERPAEATQVPHEAWEARAELRSYILEAAWERRRRPGEDLLSAMVTAEQAGSLDQEEIVGLSLILFVAGVTTTTALIGNSLHALANHPAERAKLVTAPGRMSEAVEELLRFESPIQWLTRTTTAPIRLHGCEIPQGGRVVMLFGSANRDERRWERPDELDLFRSPERHLAFGDGIHFCVGAPLARLEGRLALKAVLEISPDYEVAGPVEPRFATPSERGLGSLPLSFR